MQNKPQGRGPANRERLPEGVRRLGNRKLVVDFQDRFPDGTAFRRTKEFDHDALKAALNFLARAQADFARGNGGGEPVTKDDVLTVGAWCDYCVNSVMPAQRNGKSPKYSDDQLSGFRAVVREHIVPRVGKLPLAQLDKSTVTGLVASLPSDEARTKTLNVLTRAMELAENKGKRKKGTNPCKGVSASVAVKGDAQSWAKTRPTNWRDEEPPSGVS